MYMPNSSFHGSGLASDCLSSGRHLFQLVRACLPSPVRVTGLGSFLAASLLGLLSGLCLALVFCGHLLGFANLLAHSFRAEPRAAACQIMSITPCSCVGTWMSIGKRDHDIVELSVDFAGLSISVRGPTDSAARFVQHLGGLQAAGYPASPSAASSAPNFQSPSRASTTSTNINKYKIIHPCFFPALSSLVDTIGEQLPSGFKGSSC